MKSNKVLSIVGCVLLIISASLFIMCELRSAERDIAQANFQKVLVLKSKPMMESLRQDSIKQ